jgi:hypothetical protein
MKNLCVDLNFKFPLFKNERLKEKYKERHKKIDLLDINEEFFELIKNKNLTINHAQVFYLTPFSSMEIHRDKEFLQDFPKMNFVFGGKESVMQWFEPRSESVKKIIKLTPLEIPYISYNIADLKLIYRHTISQPSIIQAGIPHNVVNFIEPRQCFSFVFTNENGNYLTFKDLVTLFEDYKV